MSRVLVSFIGKTRQEPGRKTRNGYSAVHYRFPASGAAEEWTAPVTALFGAALIGYLTRNDRPVDKWLVLGTRQSDWGALIHALPVENAEIAEGRLSAVKTKIDDDQFLQGDLDEWQRTIASSLDGPECTCRITGSADTSDSQLNIWKALLDTVEEGDQIVLDVTHAFRHMPVLAAFMVNTLRWVKGVKDVDLYYGGLELLEGGNEASVIHIAMVRELMEVSEAAATYRHTGSYAQLLEQVGLAKCADASSVLLAEETNQNASGGANNLLKSLERAPNNPIRESIIPLVKEPLERMIEQKLAQRMARKTRFAYNHGQYFKAIALLWETILVAGCESFGMGDGSIQREREQAEDKLYKYLEEGDRVTLKDVEHTRNAVVHGMEGGRQAVNQALVSMHDFQALFQRGDKLLQKLMTTNEKHFANVQTP